MSVSVSAVAIGVAATLLMDAWNIFLRHAFGVASLDYCLLGRWLRHMPEGTFRHHDIRVSEPRAHECVAGWIGHYAIGIALAIVFVTLAGRTWLERPALLSALAFGLATVAFPMFVMQPALGMGIAASRTPNPGRARLKSVATHLIFGLGLYASALVSEL